MGSLTVHTSRSRKEIAGETAPGLCRIVAKASRGCKATRGWTVIPEECRQGREAGRGDESEEVGLCKSPCLRRYRRVRAVRAGAGWLLGPDS